jgi:hypothetical protein
MLPVSCQEQAILVPYPRAMGSLIQLKIKQMIFTMTWKATHGLSKILFQEVPIERATKNFKILQIMQLISVI